MSKLWIAVYVLIASSALVALKLGLKDGEGPVQLLNGRLLLHVTPFFVLGVVLYGFSFLLYTFLISRHDLGYIIPLTTALVYIIIFTASFLIFKEVFTPLKIFGISFILVGIVLLNIKS